MPFVSKKIKNLQKDTLIKNQIATLFNKPNASNLPQTVQQSIVNTDYYVSLYKNDNTDLSFNTTSNTLITKNLAIQNPPSCYVDASNSYDLVNKSFLNKYVGFDLSGGYRFYSEDWITGITKGSFNWDLSASNANITSEISIYNSQTNHPGIIRLTSRNAIGYKTVSLPIRYNTLNVKTMRFITNLTTGVNVDLRIGFFDNILDITNKSLGFQIVNVTDNIGGAVNIRIITNSGSYTFPNTIPAINTMWLLFEIQKNNNNLFFSVKNLSDNTIFDTYSSDSTTMFEDFNGNISMYFRSSQTGNGSQNRAAYIDYVDWVVSQ